jgi:histidinol-phosphate aminotransferase
MLKARPCILEISEYQSPLTDNAAALRLDLNENTTGCSPRVVEKIRGIHAQKMALYTPRDEAEKTMAAFLGLQPSQVLLTNGADEGIDLICRTYLAPQDEMIIATPAFNMYEIFCQSAGSRLVSVAAGPDYSFPLQKVLQAITPRTRVIVITNPNNPTGVLTPRNAILEVLRSAPAAAVLVDEAYFDFCGETVMDRIGHEPNLFVARTFSKAYGLAGLRLGVIAGPDEQMAVLRRVVSPFNVNVLAIECMAEALADGEWRQAYVAQVCATREWLQRKLQDMGLKSWPSKANFVLVNFGDARPAVLQAMRQRGIALRNRPDCDGCVRITIGTQAEMEQVVASLKEVLENQSQSRQVAQ